MTWLVWRQHRGEAMTLTCLLIVLCLAVVPSGLHLQHLASILAAGRCDGSALGRGCNAAMTAFDATTKTLTSIVPWLNVLPGLVGVFIGAPLVSREIEDGTWRLAWSQSVTRSRWLSTQLAATTALVSVTIIIFTIILTWWLTPLNQINGRFTGNVLGFDFYGTVPAAWALFAFAVGVLAGALARRVVPAMAISFGAYVTVRLPTEFLIRPHYLPALSRSGVSPIASDHFRAHDWVLSQDLVAPHSQHILSVAEQSRVEAVAQSQLTTPGKSVQNLAAVTHYFQAHGYTYAVTYQPASRFWLFQSIETGICIALVIVALSAARGWVMRRLT